jgi:hypothetical protein
MKIQVVMKLLVLGALIVLVGHWLQGHDVLTGMALVSVLLLVAAKFCFYCYFLRRNAIATRNGDSGGADDGGADPAGKPVPIPPVRPQPREFSALSK